ncbi:conserved hypothetical protein [Ricinus communis]|uniref:Trafficking protein particle complex subunit n=1 Tax=Ricinus communis TaxID=3988 RepID=B9S5K7_RICCO|nr:conserved hypothetical protein [Ricinus communis]
MDMSWLIVLKKLLNKQPLMCGDYGSTSCGRYGYLTNTKVKFILVTTDLDVRDADVRNFFRRFHAAYVDAVSNPFHVPGKKITSKTFAERFYHAGLALEASPIDPKVAGMRFFSFPSVSENGIDVIILTSCRVSDYFEKIYRRGMNRSCNVEKALFKHIDANSQHSFVACLAKATI